MQQHRAGQPCTHGGSTHKYGQRTKDVDDVVEAGWVVNQGVAPEAPHVVTRRDFGVHRAQVRVHVEAVLDASQGTGERAAAVGEADLEVRQAFEHTAQHERADGHAGLRGHRHQPVFTHITNVNLAYEWHACFHKCAHTQPTQCMAAAYQGSQYFFMRPCPIMSHGWMKMAAPSSAAATRGTQVHGWDGS